MKIGIMGLGDIAQKAYLPVLTEKEGINKPQTVQRIKEAVQTVDELLDKNIQAAFISTATEAHADLAEKLLKNGVHI